MGLVSGLFLAKRLACAHIWSDSGSFLVVHASLSQDGFQHEDFWEVGRTYYQLASPPSFWPLLNSPARTVLFIRTSCRETTHASGEYRAWPRRAVSVSGSLTRCGFHLQEGPPSRQLGRTNHFPSLVKYFSCEKGLLLRLLQVKFLPDETSETIANVCRDFLMDVKQNSAECLLQI